MLKQREWKYITDFIANNDFPDQFEWGDKAMLSGGDLCDWPLWNQLNALWIAFCIHRNLEPDTREYDLRLMSIWRHLGCEGDFDDFDLFMGQHIC